MSSFTKKLSKESMGKNTYIKRNKLGEGSFGIVYEVKDKESGIIYADKMLSSTPDLNELDILCKIDHLHILRAVDFYYDSFESSFHIILPKADKDLGKYSKKKNVLKGNLSLNEAIKMMYEIISAVSFLHKLGYFHCDVKPANILMFENKPVLSDFGWTYFLGYNTDEICGTTTFTSPECVTPKISDTLSPYNKSCDQIKADIYSLGSTFFYLLTGNLLIENDKGIMLRANYSVVEHKLQNYINNISEPYVSLRECFKCILEMCRAEPTERLKSITEVLQQPVFSSRGLSEPIGGKVKVTNIPNTICNNLTTKEIEMSISRIFEVSLDLQKVYNNYGYNLYELCILPSLYVRCITTLDSSFKGAYMDRYIVASVFIADSLSGKETQEINKYTKYALTNPSSFYSTVIECIQKLEGCLSMPIIYPMTDNGLECFWYITQCLIEGCSFIFTHPTEVHNYYSLLEEKQPDLKDLRFLKNQNNILKCDIYPDNKVFVIVIKEMMNGKSNVTLKLSYDPSSRPSVSSLNSLDYSNKGIKRWVEIVDEKKELRGVEDQGSSAEISGSLIV